MGEKADVEESVAQVAEYVCNEHWSPAPML